MTTFNDVIAEKANNLKDLIVDSIGSLQKINSLFTHDAKEKPCLTKEGHGKLSAIGLLKSDGGSCDKCGASRNLQKRKQKSDGLTWKCSKCKANEKSMRHCSMFHNS